ncbi:Rho GTPase activating protein [Parasponia andersonii]|uniref:Rho GTPase activating protein n=1 Tax=Parasponia andersonii TaxID=3476 RepID=A0A2P5C8G8_PARAD|nr:Rho GTPase activating protein [Parasponia andersonii]
MAESPRNHFAGKDTLQRHPQPEKEYQSFSLIYSNRSLDLICKDKDEAEVWLAALSQWRTETRSEVYNRTALVFSYTAATKECNRGESVAKRISLSSSDGLDDTQSITSATDTFRTSVSSAVSSSSKGSFYEDIDNFNDVFIWGEGIGNGVLGGGIHRVGTTTNRMDALLPKALESTVVLDPYNIACGSQHAVLITKQKQLFSWGEGSGGRLGRGDEADIPHPKLIDGDLYTWGDGTRDFCILGHGSEASHWAPKKLRGQDSPQVSFISSGPWHTAFVTSAGQLFTLGDGTIGALGHGDHSSTAVPREVENFKGLRTVRAACAVWHTVAVVEVTMGTSSDCNSSLSGKLYTWGDGDKGQLRDGDKKHRLIPSRVAVSDKTSFCQVACGYIMTIALTTSGQVYTMGSADFGQPCIHESVNKVPIKVEGHGDNGDRKDPTLVKALKDKQVKKVYVAPILRLSSVFTNGCLVLTISYVHVAAIRLASEESVITATTVVFFSVKHAAVRNL